MLMRVAMAGNKDDGHLDVLQVQHVLQRQAGGLRHADIQHQAADLVRAEFFQKSLGVLEGLHAQTLGADEQG